MANLTEKYIRINMETNKQTPSECRRYKDGKCSAHNNMKCLNTLFSVRYGYQKPNCPDYEQKKRECFVKFCKDNGIDQEVNISIFDAFDQIFDRAYALGKKFGISDFSDAEGEEMLTVSRNNVMAYYRDAQEDEEESLPAVENACNNMYQRAVGRRQMLKRLFGSKCLPDNVESSRPNGDSSEPNVDSSEPKKSRRERCGANTIICAHMNCQDYPPQSEPKYRKGEKVCYNGYVYEIEGLVGKNRYALKGLNFDLDEDMIEPYEHYTEPLSQNSPENCDNKSHISADCNKQAEPKFKVGDIVRFKYCCTPHRIDGFKMLDGVMLYQVGEVWAEESDLEPYTEPKEDLIASNSGELKSQEADKHSDNILKDSFAKERRLNIAAMMMQGLLANPNNNSNLSETVVDALNCADALIAEVEKGNSDGED